jgi:hypothetical protein
MDGEVHEEAAQRHHCQDHPSGMWIDRDDVVPRDRGPVALTSARLLLDDEVGRILPARIDVQERVQSYVTGGTLGVSLYPNLINACLLLRVGLDLVLKNP